MDNKKLKNIGKELFTDDERFALFLSKNWKLVIIIAVGIIAIITASLWWKNHQIQKNAALESKLLNGNIDDLPALIEQNSKAVGVTAAKFRLAGEATANKKYAEAAKIYRSIFENSDADIIWREYAATACGNCLEQSGDVKSAIDIWRRVRNEISFDLSLRVEAGFHAGRLLIAVKDKVASDKILSETLAIANNQQLPGVMFWTEQIKALRARIKNGDFDTPVVKK